MEKAQPPNIIHKWKSDFNLWDDHLRDVFLLPHSVVLKSYVKAFQYKVLNNILYTNKKLVRQSQIVQSAIDSSGTVVP